MQTPLLSKNKQRKMPFKPSKEVIYQIFDLLNENIYHGHLTRPAINLRSLTVWGLCTGFDIPHHYCKIKLHKKWFCVQWMITILAHEMAHQYQWEIHGPIRASQKQMPLLSHGPTFFEFRAALAEYGIPLKATYCDKKWFKNQNIMKV